VNSVVHVARRDGILIAEIDRPDRRNALNAAVAHELTDALAALDSDDDLLVGVLTGAGGFFSSGLDLKEFGRDGSEATNSLRELLRRGSRKPIIAAVEGFALAGGFELCMMCDLIVAARGARFGLPEVKRALVANGGGLLRLPSRIPYSAAAEIALTGGEMTAERLYELGLINHLVSPGAAFDQGMLLAGEISQCAPLALVATKQILSLSDSVDGWSHQDSIADPVFQSSDAQEGARAFIEKRPPRWAAR
jgi:enoyl-CoA hydratase